MKLTFFHDSFAESTNFLNKIAQHANFGGEVFSQKNVRKWLNLDKIMHE